MCFFFSFLLIIHLVMLPQCCDVCHDIRRTRVAACNADWLRRPGAHTAEEQERPRRTMLRFCVPPIPHLPRIELVTAVWRWRCAEAHKDP